MCGIFSPRHFVRGEKMPHNTMQQNRLSGSAFRLICSIVSGLFGQALSNNNVFNQEEKMNTVIEEITGYVGGVPEIRHSQGKKYATFSVCVSEDFPYGNQYSRRKWHKVVASGKLADYVQQKITKGSPVSVEGVITTRQYFFDGKPRTSIGVVATGVTFLTKQMMDVIRQDNPQPEQETYQKTFRMFNYYEQKEDGEYELADIS
jgi:single-strand DNA-binding protein